MASFFVSRVDTEADRRKQEIGGHDELLGTLRAHSVLLHARGQPESTIRQGKTTTRPAKADAWRRGVADAPNPAAPGANTPPRRRDAGPPYLHELGERWAHAKASVAQEHFASVLPRALARDWGRGRGPHALLACVPGDQHDLGLICFGLALRAHGWRITYLGADTRYPR